MFIRTEKSIKDFMHFYPVVSTLVIINIALYLLIYFIPLPAIDFLNRCGLPRVSASSLGDQIYACGIGFNPAVANGEYWRLVTPIFLHGGLMHVLFNSFATVLFAPALEQMLGKFRFLILYFLAGIVGNIGTYLVDPEMLDPHLGASGAIYGILGLYVFMIAYRKHLIDPASTQIVMIILIIGLLMSFMQTGINIAAHVFGFIGGFALGPPILVNVRPFSPWRNRPRDSVVSQPKRKRRRHINPTTVKKIVWTVIGILLAAAVLSMLGIL